MDPKEHTDTDEAYVYNEIDEEKDIVLTADNGISVEGKDVAHFEQMPRKQGNIKFLTETESKGLMDQILSEYST